MWKLEFVIDRCALEAVFAEVMRHKIQVLCLIDTDEVIRKVGEIP